MESVANFHSMHVSAPLYSCHLLLQLPFREALCRSQTDCQALSIFDASWLDPLGIKNVYAELQNDRLFCTW